MVFSSLEFIFFYLPAVLLIYFLIPAKFLAARNFALFIVSLLFYGWSEPTYIWIMLLSIAVDYTCGRLISKYKQTKRRIAKMALIASVVINLSILGFFKYADFIIANLSAIPIFSGLKPLGVPLPVGISFYTFQTMSYTLDVYLGEACVQKNIASFGSYVTMFPQLIAGPIVRYRDVDADLRQRSHNIDNIARGIKRFVCGLAKKVLLANTAGTFYKSFVDGVSGNPSVVGAWMGIVFFAFQIYFDFSGYSDMAIGLGYILGFKFPENFNYPYISKSITEFWQRWHISLGSWFRDYVYIPLGGSRVGKIRLLFNILTVWMLTGFWHGATWNFVVWGLYFAAFLIIEKLFLLNKLEKFKVLNHIYVLFFVIISFVIFNAADLPEAMQYIGAMFGAGDYPLISAECIYYAESYALTFVIAIFAATPIAKNVINKAKENETRENLINVLEVLHSCSSYFSQQHTLWMDHLIHSCTSDSKEALQ